MGLIVVFLFYFLVYSFNGRLAKARGRSPIAWGFISLLAFLLAQGIFGSIYVEQVYKGPMTPEGFAAFLTSNPLSGLLIILFGFGGVLAVRFYLERSSARKR
jgi:hypothetical protein